MSATIYAFATCYHRERGRLIPCEAPSSFREQFDEAFEGGRNYVDRADLPKLTELASRKHCGGRKNCWDEVRKLVKRYGPVVIIYEY